MFSSYILSDCLDNCFSWNFFYLFFYFLRLPFLRKHLNVDIWILNTVFNKIENYGWSRTFQKTKTPEMKLMPNRPICSDSFFLSPTCKNIATLKCCITYPYLSRPLRVSKVSVFCRALKPSSAYSSWHFHYKKTRLVVEPGNWMKLSSAYPFNIFSW